MGRGAESASRDVRMERGVPESTAVGLGGLSHRQVPGIGPHGVQSDQPDIRRVRTFPK